MAEAAILKNYERYGFSDPVVGLVRTTDDNNNYRRVLHFGHGRWLEVEEQYLIYVELSEANILALFGA